MTDQAGAFVRSIRRGAQRAALLIATGLGLAAVLAAAPQDDPSRSPTVTGEGRWTFSNGQRRVELTWTGAFRVADDDRRIEWVAPGSRVMITNGAWWLQTGVEIIAAEDGSLEQFHFRRGFTRDWEPGGREYLEGALEVLIRHAGLGAEARVARLLQSGGPAAVHAAIETLETDSARRHYYLQLLEQADLGPDETAALVDTASGVLRSDSYRRALLRTAASRIPADHPAYLQLIGRTAAIDSDAYQRSALQELMPEVVTPPVAAAVLTAATRIDSDSYRATVLTDLVEKGGLTAGTSAAFFPLVADLDSASYQGRVLRAVVASGAPDTMLTQAIAASSAMSSDSEQRRVLSAALDAATTPLTPALADALLAAMASVGSDSYRSALLVELLDRHGLRDDAAPAFFSLVTGMSSSSYERRVLEAVLAIEPLTPEVHSAWLRAVPSVSSDSEVSRLLLASLRGPAMTTEQRDLFLTAVDAIDSDSQQSRVLAELVRMERGG